MQTKRRRRATEGSAAISAALPLLHRWPKLMASRIILVLLLVLALTLALVLLVLLRAVALAPAPALSLLLALVLGREVASASPLEPAVPTAWLWYSSTE